MAEQDARERAYAEQAMSDLTDRIAGAVARVVDDIRHKVVEEPWFGREVTDTIMLVQGAIGEQREAERDLDRDVASFYGLDREEEAPEPEQDMEPEIDMER